MVLDGEAVDVYGEKGQRTLIEEGQRKLFLSVERHTERNGAG